MTVTASIIIRAFNESKHIGKLLYGLSQQTKIPDEIILVDSGSTDNTVEIAEGYDAKIVTVPPEEFTFGKALNIGCEAATGDILVFVSAHVYPVTTNWLRNILQPFENSKVEIVYGKQIGCETTKYSEHQVFKTWFLEDSIYDQQTDFCNNANCAIRKESWMNQHYDENLPGLEDIHWAKNMRKRSQGRIVYLAESEIVHVHDETWKQVFRRYFREAVAMKEIDNKFNLSFPEMILVLTRSVFSDSYHALKEKCFFKNFISICIFRYMQYFGAYKGANYRKDLDKSLKRKLYYPSVNFNSEKKTQSEDVDIINYNQM